MSERLKVSSFGMKVLQRMAGSRPAEILSDGRIKIGALIAPEPLARELERLDLVHSKPPAVHLTSAGQAFVRRMDHLHKNCRSRDSIFPQNPFSAQHAQFAVEECRTRKKVEKIVRNYGDSPLAWLMRRKDRDGQPYLTCAQFDAGESFCRDYEYAGLMPRATGYYDGVPVTGKTFSRSGREEGRTMTQISAKRRVDAALKYVGPGLSDVLVRVCCFHEGLEQAEKTLAWPTRSGKLVLKIALDRLTEFYNPIK